MRGPRLPLCRPDRGKMHFLEVPQALGEEKPRPGSWQPQPSALGTACHQGPPPELSTRAVTVHWCLENVHCAPRAGARGAWARWGGCFEDQARGPAMPASLATDTAPKRVPHQACSLPSSRPPPELGVQTQKSPFTTRAQGLQDGNPSPPPPQPDPWSCPKPGVQTALSPLAYPHPLLSVRCWPPRLLTTDRPKPHHPVWTAMVCSGSNDRGPGRGAAATGSATVPVTQSAVPLGHTNPADRSSPRTWPQGCWAAGSESGRRLSQTFVLVGATRAHVWGDGARRP